MEKSFYIDSNIFIFAYSEDKENGVVCRKILDLIIENKITAFTSTLTFDEIFNKIMRLKDKQTALIVSDLFLNLNNLKFIEVDLNIVSSSLFLLKKYNLGLRDAIHLACAFSKDLKNIITNDKDFDKIEEIKRHDIKEFR